jgi:exodeoxyribonuclease V alpha subunit
MMAYSMETGEKPDEGFEEKLEKFYLDTRISKTAKFRIWEKYHFQAVKRIEDNPYQLVYDIRGVGFLIADRIARNVGFGLNSWQRIRAAIYYSLKSQAPQYGHTCVPLNFLLNLVRKLIEVDVQLIENQVNVMLDDGQLIPYKQMLYLPYMYDDEMLVSQKLLELLMTARTLLVDGAASNGELMEDQVRALSKANLHGVFILTGAPGTGKTYTITYIIDQLPRNALVKLAAPTGKAAKRMMEQTGRNASTIHRLLEPQRDKGGDWLFRRNATNPIDADVVILDEVSMMPVPLMASFMTALSPRTKLIMVGDIYQLPPVGAGFVLRDMIHSRVIPTEELTIIKRQDPGLIIENCHAIKNGEDITVDNTRDGDFILLHNEEEKDIQRVIVKTLMETLPAKYPDMDILREVQVISPMREKTMLSCLPLNILLQNELNSKAEKHKKTDFRVGDKVINMKNDYDKNIINGDIGYVQEIYDIQLKIIVQFENPEREVTLHLHDNDLQLAYAITCHKYQGSESRVVILPIHPCFAPILMQRNWLYTAVSRAKELCIIIGQKQEIPRIIQRNKQIQRYTGLTSFLTEG